MLEHQSTSPIYLATSALHDPSNIVSAVRQPAHHFSSKYIPKVGISLTPALELLIESLNEFDKFASVDVWIPRSFHVVNDFWW